MYSVISSSKWDFLEEISQQLNRWAQLLSKHEKAESKMLWHFKLGNFGKEREADKAAGFFSFSRKSLERNEDEDGGNIGARFHQGCDVKTSRSCFLKSSLNQLLECFSEKSEAIGMNQSRNWRQRTRPNITVLMFLKYLSWKIVSLEVYTRSTITITISHQT